MSTAAQQLLSLPALTLPASARASRLLPTAQGPNADAPFSAVLSAELRSAARSKSSPLTAANAVAETLPITTKTLPGRVLDPKEAAKIKSTAQDFESLLVYQLLKEMWNTIPESGLLNGGLSTQYFREMWLEELSKKVSQSGNGLGVARIIERELTETALRTVNPADLPPAK